MTSHIAPFTDNEITIEDLATARILLNADEESIAQIISLSPAAIAISSLQNGTYRAVNRSCLHLYGYRQDELIGKSALKLDIWERPEDRDILVGVLRTKGICKNFETRIRTKQGTIRTVHLSATQLEIAGEKCILTMAVDLTRQRRAELALADQLHQEQIIGEIMATFINSSSASFRGDIQKVLTVLGNYTRSDRCYIYLNSAEGDQLERSFQWTTPQETEATVLQNPPAVISLLKHTWAWELFYAEGLLLIHDITDTSGNKSEKDHFMRLCRRNGIHALLTVPMFQDGELYGLIGIDSQQPHFRWRAADITALRNVADLFVAVWSRHQAELALQTAMETANSGNKAKSDFLATMSHEIRTPLNCVLGITDLLQSMDHIPEQDEYFETIKKSGVALLTLLNDILDQSKIEAGLMFLDPVRTNLQQTIEDVVKLLEVQATAKGLELTLIQDSNLPRQVICDAGRLRQVLINLLNNAIKFTEKGEVSLELQLMNIVNDQAFVRFRISDTGIGIDSVKLTEIFKRFTQADTSTTRKYGGSGLGLTLSRQLVQIMGGSLEVDTQLDVGSNFEFTIPLRCCENQEEIPDPNPQQPDLSKQYVGHILLAEDNPFNQKITTELLAMFGCTTDVAQNGEEACRKASANRYDLVLMDCRMPKMSGYECTREIRRLPGDFGRVPIVAMTASAMPSDRKRGLEAGMDDFAVKPINRYTLLDILEQWLA